MNSTSKVTQKAIAGKFRPTENDIELPTLWWLNQFGILLPGSARLHVKSILQAMLLDVEYWCDDLIAHTIFRGSPIFSPNCLQLTNLRNHSLANLVIYLGKLTKIIYFYITHEQRRERRDTRINNLLLDCELNEKQFLAPTVFIHGGSLGIFQRFWQPSTLKFFNVGNLLAISGRIVLL